jgi:hypothetical protein
MEVLLAMVESQGSIRLSNLQKALDVQDSGLFFRSIGWLGKMGFLKLINKSGETC